MPYELIHQYEDIGQLDPAPHAPVSRRKRFARQFARLVSKVGDYLERRWDRAREIEREDNPQSPPAEEYATLGPAMGSNWVYRGRFHAPEERAVEQGEINWAAGAYSWTHYRPGSDYGRSSTAANVQRTPLRSPARSNATRNPLTLDLSAYSTQSNAASGEKVLDDALEDPALRKQRRREAREQKRIRNNHTSMGLCLD